LGQSIWKCQPPRLLKSKTKQTRGSPWDAGWWQRANSLSFPGWGGVRKVLKAAKRTCSQTWPPVNPGPAKPPKKPRKNRPSFNPGATPARTKQIRFPPWWITADHWPANHRPWRGMGRFWPSSRKQETKQKHVAIARAVNAFKGHANVWVSRFKTENGFPLAPPAPSKTGDRHVIGGNGFPASNHSPHHQPDAILEQGNGRLLLLIVQQVVGIAITGFKTSRIASLRPVGGNGLVTNGPS